MVPRLHRVARVGDYSFPEGSVGRELVSQLPNSLIAGLGVEVLVGQELAAELSPVVEQDRLTV